MKHFTVDPRDGGFGISAGCHTCCCQTILLRPGETDKMVVNYAPWSVPIGGPGLIPGGTEINISRDSSACATGAIDGFSPPQLGVTTAFTALPGAATVLDVGAGAEPAGNTFTYRVLPLSGPYKGTVTNPTNGPEFTYQSEAGYTGTDSFYVEMTDAQGRKLIQLVVVSVGNPGPVVVPANLPYGLYVDRTKIAVDARHHQISFPISLMPDAKECERFRLEIRQAARDCDNVYSHYACFDIFVGKC
jgi:Bacterial Ig domain